MFDHPECQTKLSIHLNTKDHIPTTDKELLTDVLDDFEITGDIGTFQQLCLRFFHAVLKNASHEAGAKCRAYVKHGLKRGTGDMLKYISQEEREYLNIPLTKASGFNNDLHHFLNVQRETWTKLWISADHAQVLESTFHSLHQHAYQNV